MMMMMMMNVASMARKHTVTTSFFGASSGRWSRDKILTRPFLKKYSSDMRIV
jgi:hypothetical protein